MQLGASGQALAVVSMAHSTVASSTVMVQIDIFFSIIELLEERFYFFDWSFYRTVYDLLNLFTLLFIAFSASYVFGKHLSYAALCNHNDL